MVKQQSAGAREAHGNVAKVEEGLQPPENLATVSVVEATSSSRVAFAREAERYPRRRIEFRPSPFSLLRFNQADGGSKFPTAIGDQE